MTTTERTTALGGDEAAEQRSAPNLDAGVVGDLVAAFRAGVEYAAEEMDALGDERSSSPVRLLKVAKGQDVEREHFAAAARWLRDLDPCEVSVAASRAALAKYATQGTGGPVAWLWEDVLPGRKRKVVWRVVVSPEEVENLRRAGVELRPLGFLATHQPANSTDRSVMEIEMDMLEEASAGPDGAADHEGAGT